MEYWLSLIWIQPTCSLFFSSDKQESTLMKVLFSVGYIIHNRDLYKVHSDKPWCLWNGQKIWNNRDKMYTIVYVADSLKREHGSIVPCSIIYKGENINGFIWLNKENSLVIPRDV